MITTTVAKQPIIYEPSLMENGVYKDYLSKYTWSEFEEYGVKCPCAKRSATIHRNKNSFKHQHCKSKKHIEFLKNLNKSSSNISKNSPEELVQCKKEIKEMKVQLGKDHQKYLIEKQRNETLQNQLKEIITQKEEIACEMKQNSSFIVEIVASNNKLKDKLKKYEKVTKTMMSIEDYELAN
tara:strand:- start:21911 stop:22453 length:543 start_codon:yes stop_codon:yes gene_type:complete